MREALLAAVLSHNLGEHTLKAFEAQAEEAFSTTCNLLIKAEKRVAEQQAKEAALEAKRVKSRDGGFSVILEERAPNHNHNVGDMISGIFDTTQVEYRGYVSQMLGSEIQTANDEENWETWQIQRTQGEGLNLTANTEYRLGVERAAEEFSMPDMSRMPAETQYTPERVSRPLAPVAARMIIWLSNLQVGDTQAECNRRINRRINSVLGSGGLAVDAWQYALEQGQEAVLRWAQIWITDAALNPEPSVDPETEALQRQAEEIRRQLGL